MKLLQNIKPLVLAPPRTSEMGRTEGRRKKTFWEITSIVYFVLHEKLVAFFLSTAGSTTALSLSQF